MALVISSAIRVHHLFMALVAISFLIVLNVIFSPSAAPRLISLWHKEELLKQESVLLQNHISQKTTEILLLSSDTPKTQHYLEKIAREELSFLHHDELFVVIEPREGK